MINNPSTDEDTFQLTPDRTLFASGKFVFAWAAIISADGVSIRRNGVIQSIIQARVYNVGKL
jgi:hypothetical protein